jgi:ABC-2 type transport system permease protein
MFNRRTLAIIKRELRTKLFSKSFILMTLLVPLFMILIFSIQYFIHSMSDEQRSDIIIVSDSDEILNKVQNEIFQTSTFKSGDLTSRTEKSEINNFESKLNQIKSDLINQRVTGVVFIPSSALQTKEVKYYSSNPNNSTLFYKIKPSINKALVEIYFSNKQLTQEEITFARKEVEINGFRVSSDKEVAARRLRKQNCNGAVFFLALYGVVVFRFDDYECCC